MNIFEILLLAVSLSMDACAVSLCQGMQCKKRVLSLSLKIALLFGIFQAVMPILGYIFGNIFSKYILMLDHWIAFSLLSFIGINMILDTENSDEGSRNNDLVTLIVLAIATSIDALAVGITFSFLSINLINSVTIIGITTFILSAISVLIGYKFGNRFQRYARYIGGITLILIAIKILLEHLLSI